MSQNNRNQQLSSGLEKQFSEELSAVEEKLMLAFDGLYAPLSGLVRAQILQAKPHLRAGVVLATATKDDESTDLREKRIYLAAALEMLYVALNIHELLFGKTEVIEDTLDKSVLGSTILAGDYCFSHAASLAVKTNDPEIVAIFSETLQTISENQLRTLFDSNKNVSEEKKSGQQSFDASAELFVAGIRSSNVLVPLNVDALAACEKLVQELSAQLLHKELSFSYQPSALTSVQQQRWNYLIQLFSQI